MGIKPQYVGGSTRIPKEPFPIERKTGDEEWWIYYRINAFEEVEKPVEVKLLKAEEERVAKGKPRFTIVNKNQYDYIQEGDELLVSWRWLGKNEIQIISAGKPVTSYTGK